MTIARTRTSPLDNDPASNGRNGNITSPSKDQLQTDKRVHKQEKILSWFSSPVPFELVVCQIKHVEIVRGVSRRSDSALHKHRATQSWANPYGAKSKFKDNEFLVPGKQPWCPRQLRNARPSAKEGLQLDVTCSHAEFNLTLPARFACSTNHVMPRK